MPWVLAAKVSSTKRLAIDKVDNKRIRIDEEEAIIFRNIKFFFRILIKYGKIWIYLIYDF
jgi:hypothetical protein